MDINFHYFAVKVLASRAGFPEEQAQLIATYSQFVDDFTSYQTMALEDVPPYAQYLASKLPNTDTYLFNPVTTGFVTWFDMALLVLEKNQKWIATPFHFIPERAVPLLKSRTELKVRPASLEKPSLIQALLLEAKNAFLDKRNDGNHAEQNLMQIGTLLHTFADTYAHQCFSGYQGWENQSFLKKVTDNLDGKDITSSYSPYLYCYLPSIGHCNVNHAPDDSNVTFEMCQKASAGDSKYSITYSRNNTSEFCIAAKEIFNYLRSCLGLPPISADGWASLENLLRKGFLTAEKQVAPLSKHWNSYFPEISFHYDSSTCYNTWLNVLPSQAAIRPGQAGNSEISSDILYTVKSELFYRYNVFCDKTRKLANGIEGQSMDWFGTANPLSDKEKELQILFHSENT